METRILVEVTDQMLVTAINRYNEMKAAGYSDENAEIEAACALESSINAEFRQQRGALLKNFKNVLTKLLSKPKAAKV